MTAVPALPVDPVLPSTRDAWDADRMREVFQRELPRWGLAGADVAGCRIERFRHRPARRSIVLYALELRERAGGRRRRQWISGSIYPHDRPHRLCRKLRRDRASAADGPGVACIDALNMLVQIYPFDRYLPSLPRLAGRAPAPLLDAIRAHAGECGGIERCEVSPVRYRPGVGATLRCDVSYRSAPASRYYVKVYRPGEGREAGRRALALHARLSSGRVRVAQPVAWLPELDALLLAAAPGRSLEHSLCAGGSGYESARHVAAGLAALHELSPPEVGEPCRPDVCAGGDAHFVRWALPELSAALGRVLRGICDAGPGAAPRLTHGDLKPDHAFVDGARVYLVDVDTCAGGDPARDVASLVARLDLLVALGRVGARRAHGFRDALISEYVRRGQAPALAALDPWYAAALLRAAVYLIQHQVPDWPDHVRRFVARAERAVRRDRRAPGAP